MTSFFFDPLCLKGLAEKYRETYAQATPFPHVVIDNFLPEDALNEVLNEFPSPTQIDWLNRKVSQQPKKLESRHETQLGPATRQLLLQFNSGTFVTFLEELTSIDGIIPDPHFFGGGLHSIQRGGFLKIHSDFTWLPKLRLDRRLNLLLFLNKDWLEEYGGHFELWDVTMSQCQKKVLPIFNRCVIFNTSTTSYHGHPDPLACPEDRYRKSVALYYYTNGFSPTDHSSSRYIETLWQSRPGEPDKQKKKSSVKSAFLKITPPILLDLKKYLFNRKGN